MSALVALFFLFFNREIFFSEWLNVLLCGGRRLDSKHVQSHDYKSSLDLQRFLSDTMCSPVFIGINSTGEIVTHETKNPSDHFSAYICNSKSTRSSRAGAGVDIH